MQPEELSQYSDYVVGWIIQGLNPSRVNIFALVQNTGPRLGKTCNPPRDKAPRHEADHSSPSITDIKNE